MAREWIDDNLPETTGYYIATYFFNNSLPLAKKRIFTHEIFFDTDSASWTFDEATEFDSDVVVLAWMEMPLPYKEKGE